MTFVTPSPNFCNVNEFEYFFVFMDTIFLILPTGRLIWIPHIERFAKLPMVLFLDFSAQWQKLVDEKRQFSQLIEFSLNGKEIKWIQHIQGIWPITEA